jgi:hypothetical protein
MEEAENEYEVLFSKDSDVTMILTQGLSKTKAQLGEIRFIQSLNKFSKLEKP